MPESRKINQKNDECAKSLLKNTVKIPQVIYNKDKMTDKEEEATIELIKGSVVGSKSNAKVMKKVVVQDENEKVETETELVPPDGGWGWLILCGSMLVNILVPGTVKSFGVLFVEFLEVFDATPAAAAWIPALCYFLYSSLGPLSSILSVKYSYRTVTLIGGTFAAVGMILSFWATSVNYLYISYGVMVGTGAGLSFPPTVYIVMSYFVRLRGVANGLCISGSAIGSIILPPFLRYLLETYGYRGAVLIMGGITLNVWVGAMFYHPVEQHMKRVPKVKQQNDDDDNDDDEDDDDNEDDGIEEEENENENEKKKDKEEEEEKEKKKKQKNDDDKADDAKIKSTIISPSNDVLPSIPVPNERVINGNNSFIRSASSAAVQNYYKQPVSPMAVRETTGRQRKISMPTGKEMSRNKSHAITKSQIHSTPSLCAAVPRSGNRSLDFYSHSRLPNSRQRHISHTATGGRLPRRSPSTSSFQYVSTPYHGSTLSALHPEEFASSLTLRSLSLNPVSTCCKADDNEKQTTVPNTNKYFDITLLKDALYLVILISNSTNAISYTNFIIFLPSYATELGYDKSMAAYLISVVSALDLVGRIGGSALSDTGLIPKQWYFIGGLLVSGIALSVIPLATSYGILAAVCGVFGLASGVYVGVTAVIMADMLGEERLQSSYGISLFVNGILQLAGPPLCGIWLQESMTAEELKNNPAVSYNSLFSILGIVLIVGAAIWGIVPFIKRKNKSNNSCDELIS